MSVCICVSTDAPKHTHTHTHTHSLPPCIGYILIPALRAVGITLTNANISRRNSVRRAHAAALLQPTRDMARKLKAAAGLGHKTREIREDDVYYTTAKSLLEQSAQHDPQREAWDAALQKKPET